MTKLPVLLLSLVLLAGCTSSTSIPVNDVKENAEQKISVVANFYPLAFLAETIGGENVRAMNLTPAGTEPHEYEPTPREIVALYQTQLLIYHGANWDPWAEKIAPELKQNGVQTFVATDALSLLTNTSNDAESPSDPHVWNDPILFITLAERVRDTLIALDPTHTTEYRNNATNLKNKLDAIDAEYRKALAHCRLDSVITSHDAFAYLGKRYGIRFISIAGLSPEAEPTLAHLAELTRLMRAQKIHYVAFETLASPKIAETLARETGAQTFVLNPLEGLTVAEQNAGKNFLDLMHENLRALTTALECEQE